MLLHKVSAIVCPFLIMKWWKQHGDMTNIVMGLFVYAFMSITVFCMGVSKAPPVLYSSYSTVRCMEQCHAPILYC